MTDFLSTGTITATNASTAITGSGTNFLVAGVKSGDLLFVPESTGWVPYGIAAVASDTALTLESNYEGSTGAGKSFFIMRRFDEEKAAETYRLLNEYITSLDDGSFVDTRLQGAAVKATPIDADKLNFLDSAASFAVKYLLFSDLWTWIKAKLSADSTLPLYLTSVAGTNTITATSSPVITAYKTGQVIWLPPANKTTGAATVNIAGLGAKALQDRDGGALSAYKYLTANRLHPFVYNGTAFDSLIDIPLVGSATWDAGSIADGDEEVTEITVTGAALGDFVQVSFSLDVADLTLTAQVTAANTVTAQLSNNTGGAIDLASGTLTVRVYKI